MLNWLEVHQLSSPCLLPRLLRSWHPTTLQMKLQALAKTWAVQFEACHVSLKQKLLDRQSGLWSTFSSKLLCQQQTWLNCMWNRSWTTTGHSLVCYGEPGPTLGCKLQAIAQQKPLPPCCVLLKPPGRGKVKMDSATRLSVGYVWKSMPAHSEPWCYIEGTTGTESLTYFIFGLFPGGTHYVSLGDMDILMCTYVCKVLNWGWEMNCKDK